MRDCAFCGIVASRQGEFANERLFPAVISFEPLNPVTPGHRLIVPCEHVTDAASSPQITAIVFEHAAWWAKEQNEDFNLITSAGVAATQSVYHLHVHYVPRRIGDGLHLPWTGQIK